MKTLITLILLSASVNLAAQNLLSRSNNFSLDMSDQKKLKDSSVPVITWTSPANETMFLHEQKLFVKFDVNSSRDIKEVVITVKEKDQAAARGSQSITPKNEEKNTLVVEKNIVLFDGVNVLEVRVENMDGIVSTSERVIHVGATALADAAKLNRHDFGVLFLTDKYDNWNNLVNPVFDGRAIATRLEKYYGFKLEVIENPSQDMIFRKLREYSERKYQPLDQLFVFFAGHGYFDESFKEGYVVVKESLKDDPGKTSYVSYNRLRNVLNTMPCEHVMLMMDVCFGGTFDDAIASSRGESVYEEISQSEFIARKLAVKTRKYLTSGGKQYVSDGIPGKHSPFAKKVLEALDQYGGTDGILILTELYPHVEKLNPEPKLGKFGEDAPGSEFVFVVK
jgi:hypothetical protein